MIPAGVPLGTYRILAVVDPYNTVKEMDDPNGGQAGSGGPAGPVVTEGPAAIGTRNNLFVGGMVTVNAGVRGNRR